LDATHLAQRDAMMTAQAGNRMRDIGKVVESHARRNGFRSIRNLYGHGVGRGLHEEPSVPNFDDHQRLAVLDRVAVLDQNLNHGARTRRRNLVHRLHRFDDQQRLSDRYLGADLDEWLGAGLDLKRLLAWRQHLAQPIAQRIEQCLDVIEFVETLVDCGFVAAVDGVPVPGTGPELTDGGQVGATLARLEAEQVVRALVSGAGELTLSTSAEAGSTFAGLNYRVWEPLTVLYSVPS